MRGNNINSPKVSICVITYNHQNYIEECLNSLVSQKTDFQYEIVIRDDKSTDGTFSILKEFSDRYPSLIRLLDSNINLGMGGNFRSVINSAKGEYIAICEGDDFFTDEFKINKQYHKAKQFPLINFFVHACYLTSGDNKKLASSTNRFFNPSFESKFDSVDVVNFKGQFAATSSYFIKSEVLKSLPAIIDDAPVLDFFIEVYGSKNNSGLFSPEVMSAYRTDVNESWTARVSKCPVARLNFAKKMISTFEQISSDFDVNENFFHSRIDWCNFIIAEFNLVKGDYSLYVKKIKPSIRDNYVSLYHFLLSKCRRVPLLPKIVVFMYSSIKYLQFTVNKIIK